MSSSPGPVRPIDQHVRKMALAGSLGLISAFVSVAGLPGGAYASSATTGGQTGVEAASCGLINEAVLDETLC